MSDKRPLYDYNSLAERTNLAPGTLRRLVSAGTLPHLRIGPRTVRFDPDAIDAWLASRSAASDAAARPLDKPLVTRRRRPSE